MIGYNKRKLATKKYKKLRKNKFGTYAVNWIKKITKVQKKVQNTFLILI